VSLTHRARAVAGRAIGAAGARPLLPAAVARFLASLNIWFWAIVGLPTLLAGVYFFAIASDQYLSEAKFVVHGPAKAPPTGLAAMMGAAANPTSEDTNIVREFILSRDAVKKLEAKDDLRDVLSRPEGDLITRFPGLLFDEVWAVSRLVARSGDLKLAS
jgi:capsule polysaccharide export protein KpsE/RkpR